MNYLQALCIGSFCAEGRDSVVIDSLFIVRIGTKWHIVVGEWSP